MTTTRHGVFGALPEEHRDQLLQLAREVSFPADHRIFEEGGRADRFWIIRSGQVALDLHVPGRRAPVVETLRCCELLGWSWLFPPYRWELGARTESPVRADEFDAAQVRALCDADPVLGKALYVHVAGVVAHRLKSARTRLLDLYGPLGTDRTV